MSSCNEPAARPRDRQPRRRVRCAPSRPRRDDPGKLRAAGLFRQFVPTRYGGFELDYGPTQLAICREIGTACGSTAWVLSVLACHAWLVGMFPEAAQDAVWAEGPDTIIASSFAPSTGAARAVDGGYVLDGIWQFSRWRSCSARWLVAAVPSPVGDERQLHFCLIPRADWEVLDTWYAAGLRGARNQRRAGRERFRTLRADPQCQCGRWPSDPGERRESLLHLPSADVVGLPLQHCEPRPRHRARAIEAYALRRPREPTKRTSLPALPTRRVRGGDRRGGSAPSSRCPWRSYGWAARARCHDRNAAEVAPELIVRGRDVGPCNRSSGHQRRRPQHGRHQPHPAGVT